MLDKEDLQAIAQLMDQQRKGIMEDVSTMMDQQRKGIMADVSTMIDQQRKDFMRDVATLMDAEFTPKFNLLAEGQAGIVERLDRLEEQVADIQSTLAVNQAVIRQHSKDIRDLKKAQ